ncbi:MAG: hypothetical protein HGN29_17575, partial [Asgard group archaeon]|nr:hypothetical protein [Asgard group archaeon]
MSKTKEKQEQPKEFSFPVVMYYIARFFNKHPRLTLKLSDWESKRLRKKTKQVAIDRPIYVLGIARAGT